MLLAFILTMPNRGSWNGGWSGDGNLYCVIRKFNGKRSSEKHRHLAGQHFYYSWSDGWGANIEVREVDAARAREIRKKSKGFCGYEWMVDTILLYGKPMADHEVKKHIEAQRNEAIRQCMSSGRQLSPHS